MPPRILNRKCMAKCFIIIIIKCLIVCFCLVRSHLLEVDLATQFNPDLVLAVEDLSESCTTCSQAVDELMHSGDISQEQKENLDNHMPEHIQTET